MEADLEFINANVITIVSSQPKTEAVVLKEDRILRVGVRYWEVAMVSAANSAT